VILADGIKVSNYPVIVTTEATMLSLKHIAAVELYSSVCVTSLA